MSIRNSSRSPAYGDDDADELPPPYTPHPTDDVTLAFGPSRPFQRPPQQPRLPQPRPPPAESLSDFARDFYAAGDSASRSAGSLPRQPQTQNSIPDDGRPTRTPVPGHPLLNNGKTLIYPAGYECFKCLILSLQTLSVPADRTPGHNTGYKSFDPSNPCRKCWDKYSKSYSGPIVYASWNGGPSNRQRPLLTPRSPATGSSPSRSLSSILNQARNDISSIHGNPPGRSSTPPSPAVFPPRPPLVPPPLPSRPQSDYFATSINRSSPSILRRNGPSSSLVVQPGDPRIGGNLCWNCLGSGRTLGFLLLSDRTCGVCGGIGRLH